MSRIQPFRALIYNSEKVGELNKVVCPPYDVISADQQTYFHNLSPYNFTHIDLGKDKPNDDKDNNKYTRARKLYDEWIKKDILTQDQKPAIYFYKQEYKIQGEKHTRMGFIALMELKDPSESRVFPHENTHAKAVNDRLDLTKSLNSQLSCIFVCYSDYQRKVEKIFNQHIINKKPFVEVEDEDKILHKLWRLEDPDLIQEINATLSDQSLFIADGHHRYRVAMEYRSSRLNKKPNTNPDAAYNFVMTYFTNIDSKDLQIFPIHRVLKSFPHNLEFLEEFFRVDRIKTKEELVILLAKAGRNEQAFGLYTREGFKLLRLKNKMLIDTYVTEGSKDYKNLDATILKYFIFDRVGIKSEDIFYTKDIKEAVDLVDTNQAEASFILNPVKISQLKAIALNGERMPPKTTYFYPKVLSGLTVYKMDE